MFAPGRACMPAGWDALRGPDGAPVRMLCEFCAAEGRGLPMLDYTFIYVWTINIYTEYSYNRGR